MVDQEPETEGKPGTKEREHCKGRVASDQSLCQLRTENCPLDL